MGKWTRGFTAGAQNPDPFFRAAYSSIASFLKEIFNGYSFDYVKTFVSKTNP